MTARTSNQIFAVVCLLAIVGGIFYGVTSDLYIGKALTLAAILTILGMGNWALFGTEAYQRRSNTADVLGGALFFFGVVFGVTSALTWVFT